MDSDILDAAMTAVNQIEAIGMRLSVCNGRRRKRILTMREIAVRCVSTLTEDGAVTLMHSGHVANSYGYASSATAACLFQIGQRRFVMIVVVSGSKGSTGFGHMVRGDRWVGGQRPEGPPPGSLEIPADCAGLADWLEDQGRTGGAALLRPFGIESYSHA